jgi:hypothetical protein
MFPKSLLLAAAIAVAICPLFARAQGNAFTYQGQLATNGAGVNGTFDFQFSVYDAPSNGTLIGGTITNLAVPVANGLFLVTPDFGSGVFTGPNRWLAIGVRSNGSNGSFAPLTPRQPITPAPYAIYAPQAGTVTGTLAVSNLPPGVALLNGNQTFAGIMQFTNVANVYRGNGGGLTNIGFNSLNTGGAVTWGGVFRPGTNLQTGSQPIAVGTGDFNGDGFPDLVCADFGDQTVIVYTNNGLGGFGPYSTNTLAVSAGPLAVAVADVNGDGRPDIITANEVNNTISILTNSGAGSFVLSTNLTGLSMPFAVVATDLNNDSRKDLVVANYGNNSLSVFTNNGNGVFALASSLSTGPNPMAVAVADLNGDGRPDLISANYGGGTLSVFTNKGAGQFALWSTPVPTGNVHDVLAADLYGNGTMQLACVDYTGSLLRILTNNGSGVFTTASSYNTGPGPISVIATDLNNDGSIDLVCADNNTNYLLVMTNNGTGSFALASLPTVGAAPHQVIAADLNGDGHPDLVSAGSGANTLSVLFNTPNYNTGTLSIWGGLTVNSNAIYVAVNGTNVGIGNTNPNPAYALDVHGFVNASSGYLQNSDARFKTNVATVKDALGKIMALRGVGYDWRQQDFPEMNFSGSRQLGFIAQELAQVLPEAVARDAQGNYSVAYSEVIPVLVEALKEEKQDADAARHDDDAKISALKTQLDELQKAVARLSNGTSAAATNLVAPPAP